MKIIYSQKSPAIQSLLRTDLKLLGYFKTVWKVLKWSYVGWVGLFTLTIHTHISVSHKCRNHPGCESALCYNVDGKSDLGCDGSGCG